MFISVHRSRVNGSILDNLLTSLYHIPKICQSVTAICCDYKILNTTPSFPNFQWLIITIILIIYYCFLKDRYKVHMLNFALYRHWRLHILQMQWCNTFVLFSTRHVLWGMSGVRSRISSWCYVQHTHTQEKGWNNLYISPVSKLFWNIMHSIYHFLGGFVSKKAKIAPERASKNK